MTADPTHRLTPEWLLEAVRAVSATGRIGLDPCTFPDNPTRADAFYTVEDDGLTKPWGGRGLVYVNHPYSTKSDKTLSPTWCQRVVEQACLDVEIVSLVPVRTDAQWWDYVWTADAICFLRGRPKHATPGGKAEGSGRFPSAVAYYGNQANVFESIFSAHGRVVCP